MPGGDGDPPDASGVSEIRTVRLAACCDATMDGAAADGAEGGWLQPAVDSVRRRETSPRIKRVGTAFW